MFGDARRIAVVGVAKNCGKTTTLNALVRFTRAEGLTPGLLSVGIDGETSDALLGTPKPPIDVEEGDWIVTAERALESSTAEIEFVDRLAIDTPLGEVMVARVVEAGEVILAGLRHRADFALAAESLEARGAERIFIDGAYGRVAGAHHDVADSVVVSTGAVVSPRVERIVAATRELVGRLVRPEPTAPWEIELLERAIAEERVLFGGPTMSPLPLGARSALVALPHARSEWRDEVRGVAIPGLVSDRVIEELLHAPGAGRTLLVPDPTVLQAAGRMMARLEGRWDVKARRGGRVLAISVNPSSIQGHSVDEAELRQELASIWPEITIVNPQDGIDSQRVS